MDRGHDLGPGHPEFLGRLSGLKAAPLQKAAHAPVKNQNSSARERLAKITHHNTSRSSKINSPVNERPY
jgi:hypothetical protein